MIALTKWQDISANGVYVCLVSPKAAAAWLDVWVKNRVLRDNEVSNKALSMSDGFFDIEACPNITLGDNNCVLDGQHRLSAMIRANKTYKMIIRKRDGDNALILPFDYNMSVRTNKDLLDTTTRIAAVANILCAISIKGDFSKSNRIDIVRPFLENAESYPDLYKRSRKRVSSAPAIAALIKRMDGSNKLQKSWIMDSYNNVATDSLLRLSPLMMSYYKKMFIRNEKLSRWDIYILTYAHFSYKKRDNSTVRPSREQAVGY